MKETAKKEISDCLINKNCKHSSILQLRAIYKKLTKEVQSNIDKNVDFTTKYKYLKERLFYFQEIRRGYYSNPHIQLKLFDNIAKKKKFTQNVIKE